MKQALQTINNIELKQFSPLEKLSDADAQELLRTSIIVNLSPGTPLFTHGDSENQLFYLIEGCIELSSMNKKTVIESGSNIARNPINNRSDKQATAVAIQQSTLVSFDADMLDLFLNWTNPDAYVVSEFDSSKGHEWLSRLLKSRGLLRFSEQQINTLLDRMNEVHFNKGDVVIAQDDNDEFYYVIKNGRATVSRKPAPNSKEIRLAELGEGDAFGEEAILTHSNRGATITMSESGELMRLSKRDFSELLAKPLLDTISWNEAQAMIATGAEFIDIRQEEEFNSLHIPGSRNIPLPLLRLKLKNFNQQRKYIICCEDGSHSSVAAFLLNRYGFDAFILDGGMTTVISQMADSAMDKFSTHDESSASETSHATNESGYGSCSLAEHWGNTVKESLDDGFNDNKALHQFQKTSATAVVKQKINTPDYKPKKQKIPTVTNHVLTNKDNSNDKLFRNILLGITVVFMTAAITMYLSPANQATISQPNKTTLSASTGEIIAPAPPANETIETITPTNTTTVVTPMSRFVTPATASLIVEGTTEPVNNKEQVTDITLISPEPITPDSNSPAAAIDPATRGFIE
ncbi:MAG TPA: cyclic nucleotide-binding domain-containing protein [Candidatus Tenderia electrophaga]|uniref:Cyclic nucleotide-binding domain-containing protein n=1 Tax=Candidatus Tenderia electrophaga TaxID=1748243 RepID=A0A832J8X7_9GAMM|nr:cyclic nucleotide-binding domain-containing protein [Candidatus Tenderia electrophaga]